MTALTHQNHTQEQVTPSRASDVKPRRFDLARNASVLALLWVGYAVIRGVTDGNFAIAAENADVIIRLQHKLGLPSEATLQSAVLAHTALIKFTNLYYLGVHFPITVAFLAWVWRNHRDKFARIRNALVVTTAAALAVHLAFPLLPPRMMHGFVDTAKTVGPDPYELGISGGANQLAAMPSLHVGWALMIAFSVIWLTASKFRWLVVIHPLITVAVVVITANHYWADAIVAAAIVAAAWGLTAGHWFERGRSLLRPIT